MPQKVGKKVGIHYYENVLSEMNLPLPSSLKLGVQGPPRNPDSDFVIFDPAEGPKPFRFSSN